MTLAERIRSIRKEQNMSLRGLASQAEISVAYLTKIEKGWSSPTVEVLERFADIFSMTVHELTYSVEEETLSLELPESLDDFIKEYREMFPELEDADWQRALAHIKLRGRYPKHHDDWLPIFASMRKALRDDT